MKKLSLIYFDVGGVLLDFRSGHQKAAEKYGVTYEDIRSIFEANWQAACRGTLKSEAYMALFANLFNIVKPYPHLTDFWTDLFLPIPETHALVHSLVKTYKLGLLTNAEEGAMQHALRKGLIPDITWDAIVDSSEHGTIKPEAHIFEIAEAMAGVRPQELFFIDDVPLHVEVAIARGWQGIVFDTENPNRSIEQIQYHLRGESL